MISAGGRGRAAEHGGHELKELCAAPGLSGPISGGGGPGRSHGCPGQDPDGVVTILAGGPISWAGLWALCWGCSGLGLLGCAKRLVAAPHGVKRAVLVEVARWGAPAVGPLHDCCCSGGRGGDLEAERREERRGYRCARGRVGPSGDCWTGSAPALGLAGLPRAWSLRRSPRGLEKAMEPLRHCTHGPGCLCCRMAASWLPRQAGLTRLGAQQSSSRRSGVAVGSCEVSHLLTIMRVQHGGSFPVPPVVSRAVTGHWRSGIRGGSWLICLEASSCPLGGGFSCRGPCAVWGQSKP
ncbi:hypothetical protein NDU88_004766 [Pleurodeles waltl]|uniref:Uncharacterized protein n=1 Tax=Pleurodeles waltl TaxID=8319 RepID=A0AAV7SJS2_PLEWA|nr:hypothetical protein NDU88_004766 [Pleurodeles waltl]